VGLTPYLTTSSVVLIRSQAPPAFPSGEIGGAGGAGSDAPTRRVRELLKPVRDEEKAPPAVLREHSRYITPVYVHHMGAR
jgi:hypothetical protein